jgi:hypothetical protein
LIKAVICCLALAIPAQAWAQNVTLPGSSGQSCVQVQVAGQKPSPFNCLNQQLQQEVQGAGSTQPHMALGATSPSNQVGTFNEQGVAEQYGQNFGKSVIPYRPPAPVFNNSLSP